MSEKEIIEHRNLLDRALKESFFKMLELKRKLGLPIVTSDISGKAIVISAEEAEIIAKSQP